MQRFFGTKHIFGYGPAFIAVAAEELQNPARLRCEAFVTFPKTSHPARVAYDRLIYNVPNDQVAPLDALPVDLPAMFDEGMYLARQLLMNFQEGACRKSRDASWLEEIPFEEIDEGIVRRMWMRGYHRKAFKVIAHRAQVQSLSQFVGGLQALPLMLREET
jgi:hypothetical protein